MEANRQINFLKEFPSVIPYVKNKTLLRPLGSAIGEFGLFVDLWQKPVTRKVYSSNGSASPGGKRKVKNANLRSEDVRVLDRAIELVERLIVFLYFSDILALIDPYLALSSHLRLLLLNTKYDTKHRNTYGYYSVERTSSPEVTELVYHPRNGNGQVCHIKKTVTSEAQACKYLGELLSIQNDINSIICNAASLNKYEIDALLACYFNQLRLIKNTLDNRAAAPCKKRKGQDPGYYQRLAITHWARGWWLATIGDRSIKGSTAKFPSGFFFFLRDVLNATGHKIEESTIDDLISEVCSEKNRARRFKGIPSIAPTKQAGQIRQKL